MLAMLALSNRDIPHVNSAFFLEGWDAEHLPFPHPHIYSVHAVHWL